MDGLVKVLAWLDALPDWAVVLLAAGCIALALVRGAAPHEARERQRRAA